MAAKRVTLAGLIPVGFEVLTLSNSTAAGLNSTNRTATVFDVSVETNNARYRADGTAPTLTTGVVLLKDVGPYRWEGFNGTAVLKFQRTTGTAKISIQSYKLAGDQ